MEKSITTWQRHIQDVREELDYRRMIGEISDEEYRNALASLNAEVSETPHG